MNIIKTITGSFFLAGAAFHMMTMYQVNHMANTIIGQQMNSRHDPLNGTLTIAGNYKENGQYDTEYLALVTSGQLSSSRKIYVKTILPIKTVLKKHAKIDKNDEVALDIISKLWATEYAKKECGRIKKQLANDCNVAKVVTKIVGRSKYVKLFMVFQFTQKRSKLIFETTTPYTYGSHEVDLLKSRRRRNLSWSRNENNRMRMYKKASKLCDKFSMTGTKCGLSALRLTAWQDGDSDKVELYAKVYVAWLQPSL